MGQRLEGLKSNQKSVIIQAWGNKFFDKESKTYEEGTVGRRLK